MTNETDSRGSVNLTWVRADNAGPLTLDGTYTYLISAHRTVWVVDPGPADRVHAQAVVDAAVKTGARRVGGILLTHSHEDHSGAVSMVRRALNAATGITVPLWAADPALVPGASPIPNELSIDSMTVAEVIHLPGHTADSIGILVEGGRMLTGDTLLGGSPTSFGADGNLRQYLQCLDILRAWALDGRISSLYPGHGRIIEGPHEALAEIERQISYRKDRIEQIRQARDRGALTLARLMDEVYEPVLKQRRTSGASESDIEQLRVAAQGNIRAMLSYITGK